MFFGYDDLDACRHGAGGNCFDCEDFFNNKFASEETAEAENESLECFCEFLEDDHCSFCENEIA